MRRGSTNPSLNFSLYSSRSRFHVVVDSLIPISSSHGTDLKRLALKHDSIITVILVRQYGTRWTLKLKSVQQSRSVQEKCFLGKRLSWTRALSRRERHDTLQTQLPLFIQEPLWPKAKWILPTIRIVMDGPEINKDGGVPRDQETSKGRVPRG